MDEDDVKDAEFALEMEEAFQDALDATARLTVALAIAKNCRGNDPARAEAALRRAKEHVVSAMAAVERCT